MRNECDIDHYGCRLKIKAWDNIHGFRRGAQAILLIQGHYEIGWLQNGYAPSIYPIDSGHELESFRADLAIGNQTVSIAHSELSWPTIAHVQMAKSDPGTLCFEFPIDEQLIEKCEDLRKGGDMAIALYLKPRFRELRRIPAPKEDQRPPSWASVRLNGAHGHASFDIPKSQWIERVLKGWHRDVILLELPAIPIRECAPIAQAYEALQRAVNLERDGHYASSLSTCRIALEALLEPTKNADGKEIKVPKKKWEKRMGAATYEWLNKSMEALKQPMNTTSHSVTDHFDRAQVKMLIGITACAVAYAAKIESEPTAQKILGHD